MPYRVPAKITAKPVDDESLTADAEWVPLAVVWVASIVYVIATLMNHSPFDTQPTLALATVVLLPSLFPEPWLRLLRVRNRAR